MTHGIASAQNLKGIQPEPIRFIFYIYFSHSQFPSRFFEPGQRSFLVDGKTLVISFDLFLHRAAEKGQVCFVCPMFQLDHGKFLFHTMAPFRCVVLVYCKQRANFLLFFQKNIIRKKHRCNLGFSQFALCLCQACAAFMEAQQPIFYHIDN